MTLPKHEWHPGSDQELGAGWADDVRAVELLNPRARTVVGSLTTGAFVMGAATGLVTGLAIGAGWRWWRKGRAA